MDERQLLKKLKELELTRMEGMSHGLHFDEYRNAVGYLAAVRDIIAFIEEPEEK